jgi:hypothetical protein
MEGADSYDLAIPNEDKEIPEMVIEFAKRPGEDPSSGSIEFNQPLNLLDVIEFCFLNHAITPLLNSKFEYRNLYPVK